jgi:diacylglycerol kinase (ATP)
MERLIIVNCWSGKGDGLRYKKIIKTWYKKRGINPVIWSTAEDGPGTAFNLGKKAVQEGFNPVCLVGGDGTYYSAVNGMIAGGASQERLPALGLIQCGIGNNFAKNAGIPKNLIMALETIETGKVADVDIGKLTTRSEEKYFLNTVSFGFDALITEKARRLKAKYRIFPKEINYLLAAVNEIIGGMKFYQISIDGYPAEKMVLLAVTNGPSYGGIFKIAPGADMQDGLLDTCCISSVGKIKALKDIGRVIRGTHTTMPEVKMNKISLLTISSQETLTYQIDGEVFPAEKEYNVKVLSGVLKILVPRGLLKEKISDTSDGFARNEI